MAASWIQKWAISFVFLQDERVGNWVWIYFYHVKNKTISISSCALSHRLHIQILSRERLLLPLLPPPAQPRSGGVFPEGSEEILNQEGRLRSRHEDTLHQRSSIDLNMHSKMWLFDVKFFRCSFSMFPFVLLHPILTSAAFIIKNEFGLNGFS